VEKKNFKKVLVKLKNKLELLSWKCTENAQS